MVKWGNNRKEVNLMTYPLPTVHPFSSCGRYPTIPITTNIKHDSKAFLLLRVTPRSSPRLIFVSRISKCGSTEVPVTLQCKRLDFATSPYNCMFTTPVYNNKYKTFIQLFQIYCCVYNLYSVFQLKFCFKRFIFAKR